MWVFSVQAGGGEVHAEIIMVSVSFREPVTHLGTMRETFSPSVVRVCMCVSMLVVFAYPDNHSSSFLVCKTSMSRSFSI